MEKEIEQKDLDKIEEILTEFVSELADENSTLIETHRQKLIEKGDELSDMLKKEFPYEDKNILEGLIKDIMASVMNNNMLACLENDWFQSLSNRI